MWLPSDDISIKQTIMQLISSRVDMVIAKDLVILSRSLPPEKRNTGHIFCSKESRTGSWILV